MLHEGMSLTSRWLLSNKPRPISVLDIVDGKIDKSLRNATLEIVIISISNVVKVHVMTC